MFLCYCHVSVLSTHWGALCLEIYNILVQGFNFFSLGKIVFVSHCKLIICDFKFNSKNKVVRETITVRNALCSLSQPIPQRAYSSSWVALIVIKLANFQLTFCKLRKYFISKRKIKKILKTESFNKIFFYGKHDALLFIVSTQHMVNIQ